MPESFRKRRIPIGSTFQAKVTREIDGGRFDASGHYQPPTSAHQNWTHQQLTAAHGVSRQLNQADSYYRGDVSVVFDTQSTARIELEVRKPTGELHGRRYHNVFSGSAGRLVRVYYSLKTLPAPTQPGGGQ